MTSARATAVGRVRTLAWLLAASLALVAVEVGMRFGSLAVIARLLGVRLDPQTPSTISNEVPVNVYRRIAAARRVVNVRGPQGRCLRESLVVGALCRRAHPVLRLGVGRIGDDKSLSAHAWIELEGVAYDLDAARFASLVPVGAA
jgi:hypothetical protein